MRKTRAFGAIAVTSQRLVVWAGRFEHIDVPHGHPLRAGVEVAVPQPLSSSRHLVIAEIGQDDRVQHQPSTWGSPTISTSTSPSRMP